MEADNNEPDNYYGYVYSFFLAHTSQSYESISKRTSLQIHILFKELRPQIALKYGLILEEETNNDNNTDRAPTMSEISSFCRAFSGG